MSSDDWVRLEQACVKRGIPASPDIHNSDAISEFLAYVELLEKVSGISNFKELQAEIKRILDHAIEKGDIEGEIAE